METPTHLRREIVFLLLVVLMLGVSAALFGAFEGFRFGYWAGQGVDPAQLGRIPIAFHGDDVISRIRFSYLATSGTCIFLAVYSAIRGSNRGVTIFLTAATTAILVQLLYFKRLVVQSADNVAIVNPHFHLISKTIALDWLLIIVSVGLLMVVVFAKYSRGFQRNGSARSAF